MAEKKEYDRKEFAVENLNAQIANMRISIKETPDRETAAGKRKGIPVLVIRSAFDHTDDMEALGIKRMQDGTVANIKGKTAEKPDEGFELLSDGLTMTVTGDESLKILEQAGVEFPGAEQFDSRPRKAVRNTSGPTLL